MSFAISTAFTRNFCTNVRLDAGTFGSQMETGRAINPIVIQ
jgi:hypothetical protein